MLQGLASKLLELKELMPNSNISGLVSRYPALVLQMQPQQVAAQLQHLEEHLPGVDVERLVVDEPGLLRVDITKAGNAALCCAPCRPCCAELLLVPAERYRHCGEMWAHLTCGHIN